MEVQFATGEQDLTHEEGYQLDLPEEALTAPAASIEIVSEQLTRRVLRMVFARAAQIRNRPHYLLSSDEEDEIAPGLTKWLNDHVEIAKLVKEADEKGAVGLLLWAVLWRVIQDLRMVRAERQREPTVEEGKLPSLVFGGVDF